MFERSYESGRHFLSGNPYRSSDSKQLPIAEQIIKRLSDRFDFLRLYANDIDNIADIFLLAEDCQIVHCLWRGHLALLNDDYARNRIANLGMTEQEFRHRYIDGKTISTEVYDHLLLEEEDYHYTNDLFSGDHPIVTNYAVSSKKLWDIYNHLPDLTVRPQAILTDGVDLTLFTPVDQHRFLDIAHRTVRFGWVGNSKWAVGDLKGINTIIKPAIQQLQAEGYAVELYSSDRQARMIPHEEMPSYYAKIDCYICASTCEGTPNPVLEAMACGIPVISTDVGLIPEVFGVMQKQFILEERSVACLKEKIKQLLHHPEMFLQLSRENQISIQSWDWKLKAEAFADYFNACLQQR